MLLRCCLRTQCFDALFRADKEGNIEFVFQDVIATSKDGHGNALLHMAATQAPASSLNHIYGPTLQMQRELQWFKLERRFWTCEGLPQQHQFTKATRLCIKDHHRRHLY
ncbi:uncharacterized protein LOC129312085 isoform X7 [Prosopis cineraria]|uniref:uncharacterized protein LOC129312085 isoform X7 n=1 Tax=Prosopis cineraria TaxID=364024 RepID=UPI00240ED20F|nr:uncharacterized protein LOC129312085 isoform X7 [Prosopis cineraria]